jgi:hypothetical protein
MRYKDWMALTDGHAQTPRSDDLVAVDRALLKFSQTGLETDLAALDASVTAWKAKQGASWATSPPNASKQWERKQRDARPVDELGDWIAKRKRMFESDKQEAIPALKLAANEVLRAYETEMSTEYRDAVRLNFGDVASPVYCYKRYGSDPDWHRHVNKARPGSRHDIADGDLVTGVTPTLFQSSPHEGEGDQPGLVSRNLRGSGPPFNRRIEFRAIEHHTLVHEMLHWCCHENFRLGASYGKLGPHFELALEGLTEWLARDALKWPGGSQAYMRIIFDVRDSIDAGHPRKDAVKAAYFRGEDVAAVCKDLIGFVNDGLPKLRADSRQASELGLVVDAMSFSRKKPTGANEDFKKRVRSAFKDVAPERLPELLKGRKEWLEWVRADRGLTSGAQQ